MGRHIVETKSVAGRFAHVASRAARQGLTLAVLAGVAIGTIGFPAAPPDLSRRGTFPCQGHDCGCQSAEQCWFGCCCLTPAQRLDWAERHGVTPPDGVTLLAEAEADEKAKAAPPDLCCAPAAQPSSCSGGKHSCCSRKAAPAKVAKRAAKPKRSDRPIVSCPTCRGGLGHWWVAAGQPLALPERPVALSPPTGSEPVVVAGVSYSFSAAPPVSRPG